MSKPFPVPIAMFMPEIPPTRNQRLLSIFTRIALNTSLISVTIGVIYAAYILFWPMKTLVYNLLPLPVESQSVHRGYAIPLVIDYCKYNDEVETIVGQLSSQDDDHAILAMGSLQRHLEKGCHTIHTRIWHVPADAQPGRYVAEFSITYTLFNVRTITLHSYSQPFQVVE